VLAPLESHLHFLRMSPARDVLRKAIVVAVLLAGCAPRERTDVHVTVAHDTVSTTPRVTNQGVAPRWTLTLLNRIGSLTDTLTAFARVRSVMMDDASNLFVADMTTNRIVMFDSTGTYVRTIGRKGAGPGEYRVPGGLGWLGDTLFVLDWVNGRIGKFSETGAWLGSMQWQGVSGPQILLTNGSDSDLYVPFIWAARGRSLAYLHLTPAGVADTMRWPAMPSGGTVSLVVCRAPGHTRWFEGPFGAQNLRAGGPAGTLYSAWSATYQIAQTTPTADTIRLIRRVADPVPISDSEWEAKTEEYREFARKSAGMACEGELVRPPAKPAFRWFGMDRDGRLWVEAYTANGLSFDVFDTSGALIASMPAPPRDETVYPGFGRGRVAIVTRDSLDVQYVEVYGLGEGGGS
jgi:hypothetical protein